MTQLLKITQIEKKNRQAYVMSVVRSSQMKTKGIWSNFINKICLISVLVKPTRPYCVTYTAGCLLRYIIRNLHIRFIEVILKNLLMHNYSLPKTKNYSVFK